ncbi:hypothetical protein P3X46_011713 [Hevea brasiliensis]|uniref:BHLH domain-containing protein n=1 Tax=Hevea brasiliensis TaxID=3981 RepID=A0ABQ9M872_HEVBR|nr:hypothetical protein P3X46_011713 [Hevea brasiliensis]
MEHSSSSFRLQRTMKERDRRMHMRDLLATLASVVRPQATSKLTVPQLLDQAAIHVRQMHARIEELKLRKEQAKGYGNFSRDSHRTGNSSKLPVLDIRSSDYTVEVNLICGLNENFMLHEVIHVLQEEGAEVMSFSSHQAGARIMYIIKTQALGVRIGINTLRIHERLKELLYTDFFGFASTLSSYTDTQKGKGSEGTYQNWWPEYSNRGPEGTYRN